jgi:hypothetical protein
MVGISTMSLDARLDAMLNASDVELAAAASKFAEELLALGEAILETWLASRSESPTMETVEGFRLLALHRQGAWGEPSFNACRESCRELVYHYNLVRLSPKHADVARRLRLGAMVVRHLMLFIDGKLEVAGFGEFCCAARPLRQQEAPTQNNRNHVTRGELDAERARMQPS